MARTNSQIAAADDLSEKLCAVLGLESALTARLIIDLQPGEPVMVYVQMLADKRILELVWPPLEDLVVRTVDGPPLVIPPYADTDFKG